MLEDKDRKRIQEIISEMECPKYFECAQSGFASLCKVAPGSTRERLRCLEDEPSQCVFAFTVGGSYYCDCPLRFYLHDRLNI